jgi:hypothetical protein
VNSNTAEKTLSAPTTTTTTTKAFKARRALWNRKYTPATRRQVLFVVSFSLPLFVEFFDDNHLVIFPALAPSSFLAKWAAYAVFENS